MQSNQRIRAYRSRKGERYYLWKIRPPCKNYLGELIVTRYMETTDVDKALVVDDLELRAILKATGWKFEPITNEGEGT